MKSDTEVKATPKGRLVAEEMLNIAGSYENVTKILQLIHLCEQCNHKPNCLNNVSPRYICPAMKKLISFYGKKTQ